MILLFISIVLKVYITRVYLNQVCSWSNAPFNILEKSLFFFFSINLLIIWTRETYFFSVVLQIQLACSYWYSLIMLMFILKINQEFATLYNFCKGVSKEAVLEVHCRKKMGQRPDSLSDGVCWRASFPLGSFPLLSLWNLCWWQASTDGC